MYICKKKFCKYSKLQNIEKIDVLTSLQNGENSFKHKKVVLNYLTIHCTLVSYLLPKIHKCDVLVPLPNSTSIFFNTLYNSLQLKHLKKTKKH